MFNKLSIRSALLISLLVVLAAALLIVQGPLATSVETLKSNRAALENDIATAQGKVEKMQQMQKTLDEIKASGNAVTPLVDYDDINAVIDELNAIFGNAEGYTITFGDAAVTGMVAERPITIKFQTASYDEAVQKLNATKTATHRFLITSTSITSGRNRTNDAVVWTTAVTLSEFEMKS